MRRLLREPLLHFLVLGALLFAFYGWLHRGLPGGADEIVVTRAQVQNLEAQFARTWQRAPAPDELRGLIDNWVREEIYYREGLAMGLEHDDAVIRRRVAQKVEFMGEAQPASPPSDADLRSWLEAHPGKYRAAPRYSLRQVYFDPQRHGKRLDADIEAARTALQKGADVRGDSTMLPAQMADAEESDVARQFGTAFAQALEGLPIGAWQGPVKSGFGLHFVQLRARTEGRVATLDEAREVLQRDLLYSRSEQAKAAYYAKLREKYKVRVDDVEQTSQAR
ncbi:MAG TPA: peptidylprolyl isomerase [Burkholderiales bacterium]|nr:peptidylprolyl isomerase [Burkholderiales bacterium]